MLSLCTRTRIARWITLLTVLASIGITTADGQEASGHDDRFSLHGYLTQAYAQSSDLPIWGITKTGRADYRLMVLQLRYAISDDDEFVTQLRHRHFGASPLTEVEPEIAVSWAFYQRYMGPVSVRVGRVPHEQGIYSETRFVGTLVPFFRAPIGFYPEGIESIDGVAVSYRTPTVAGWSAQGTVLGGSSRFNDVLSMPTGVLAVDLFFYRDYTAQLWVNTPVPGLRVGGNIHTFSRKTDTTSNQRNQLKEVSIDGTFDRFFVRAENYQGRLPSFSLDLVTRYIQVGVNVVGPFSIVYQYEFLGVNFNTPSGALTIQNRDRAAGIVYAVSPNLHMKVERHRVEGYRFDQFIAPTAPPGRTSYTIASLSVSF